MVEHTLYVKSDLYRLSKLEALSIYRINEIVDSVAKMYLYAYYGYLDYIETYSCDKLNVKVNKLNNLYLVATAGGQKDIMEYLEERGLDRYCRTIYGENAYLTAAYCGNKQIMEYLERKSLDIYCKIVMDMVHIYTHHLQNKYIL